MPLPAPLHYLPDNHCFCYHFAMSYVGLARAHYSPRTSSSRYSGVCLNSMLDGTNECLARWFPDSGFDSELTRTSRNSALTVHQAAQPPMQIEVVTRMSFKLVLRNNHRLFILLLSVMSSNSWHQTPCHVWGSRSVGVT
jgi:hypothetical protein